MTNQEAIEILKDLWRWEHSNWPEKDIRQAFDKGIEALKTQNSIIEELEKIKQEIQSIIDLADSREEDTKLAYQCQIVINERISELKGEQE